MASSSGPQFVSLLDEELRALGRTGHVRRFGAGEIVFTAGDVGDGFYLVEAGRVQISAVVGNGESRVLAIIGVGDFFGEMALLDDAPRSATAKVLAATETYYLGREEFLRLLGQHPRLAMNLIREFSARMRTLNQKYLEEIIQTERLAIVGRFAGTIVHDFKNPLQVISFAADVACSNTVTPPLRLKSKERITRQVERMTNMLQELIEFAKPTGLRPALTRVNFAQYLNPLLEEFRQEIAVRNVQLDLLNPPPDCEVRVQPHRLSRLFLNLLTNAGDEMPDGGKIFLRFIVANGELQVEVEDTGKGIAPEIASKLFQPFATHGKAHGTGLGLTICAKIVEDHGGRIWVRSETGKGATFCFTLPLV